MVSTIVDLQVPRAPMMQFRPGDSVSGVSCRCPAVVSRRAIYIRVATPRSVMRPYAIFSGDWEEAWVGENLGLEIEASNSATYGPDGGSTHVSASSARARLRLPR